RHLAADGAPGIAEPSARGCVGGLRTRSRSHPRKSVQQPMTRTAQPHKALMLDQANRPTARRCYSASTRPFNEPGKPIATSGNGHAWMERAAAVHENLRAILAMPCIGVAIPLVHC